MHKRPLHVTELVASKFVDGQLRSMPRTLGEGIRRSLSDLGRPFWTYLAAALFFNFGMSIFFFLYNLVLLDYGYSERFLGEARSAYALGGIAGAIPAGILAQRFGLRKTMVMSLGMVVLLMTGLSLFVSTAPQLCLGFLGSAASTAWSICSAPVVAQVTTESNRSLGFSLNTALGIGLGVVASLVASRLPASFAGVLPTATSGQLKQAALLVACGIIALGLWPASRLRLAPVPPREKNLYPHTPFLFRFLAAMAVWSLATNAFSPFFNAYCAQFLRMPLKQIGVAFSASQLSSMVAILVTPLVIQKVGLVAGILYTQVAAAIALGCLAQTSHVSAATPVYVMYTAFLWMSEPLMFTLLMNRVVPSERSGAFSLNLLVMSLSNAVAAPIAGGSFARYGYPTVLTVTAIATLIAACLFRLLVGGDLSPKTRPEPEVLGS